ncbi:MAG: hypothetical protein P8P80_02515 [Crocinitomicaceae bacterium]|jgi:hypothetical protein|nr:hypothetical protein [Crocinitomicaceae bacterium]MDG1734451.1 hypothetical protein [Crocinitomicaceae bacterium]
MKDPVELFENLKTVPPNGGLKKKVFAQIIGQKINNISPIQVWAVAAGFALFIGTSILSAWQTKNDTEPESSSMFINQNDLYE